MTVVMMAEHDLRNIRAMARAAALEQAAQVAADMKQHDVEAAIRALLKDK